MLRHIWVTPKQFCELTNLSMHKINEHLREQFNGEADEILLKDVMITGSSVDLPPKYLTVIQNDLKTYVEDIMGQLRALQFNPYLYRWRFHNH